MGNLALLCDEHHTLIHKPGWTVALDQDHVLTVRRPGGRLVPRGALRPTAVADLATTPADDCSEFAKTPCVDVTDIARGRHAAGDRLDVFALDVTLHAWLEASPARAA